jgi:hypothetical protein
VKLYFTSEDRTREHFPSHFEGYKKECELCEEVFESKRSLMKHCFVDHGIFEMFECIKCQKEYFTGRQFQRHQKITRRRHLSTFVEKWHSRRFLNPRYDSIQLERERECLCFFVGVGRRTRACGTPPPSR